MKTLFIYTDITPSTELSFDIDYVITESTKYSDIIYYLTKSNSTIATTENVAFDRANLFLDTFDAIYYKN